MTEKRVILEPFQITSGPKIRWDELNVRRYAPLSRAQGRVKEDGKSIWLQPAKPDEAMYGITQPRYVGSIPVRKDVQC